MSEPKSQREIDLMIEALDGEPEPEEAEAAVQRLGIDIKVWATDVRSRVARVQAEARQRRFDEAKEAYEVDVDALKGRKAEPPRSIDEQRRTMRRLIERAPASASINFHKFEQATSEELAEMIRSLRHLLGDDDE